MIEQLIDNRLNQMHNEPMSDAEWYESEYRRVFREGFGRAVDVFDRLASSPEMVAIVARMFNFYLYQLETWQHLPLDQKIPPPELVV